MGQGIQTVNVFSQSEDLGPAEVGEDFQTLRLATVPYADEIFSDQNFDVLTEKDVVVRFHQTPLELPKLPAFRDIPTEITRQLAKPISALGQAAMPLRTAARLGTAPASQTPLPSKAQMAYWESQTPRIQWAAGTAGTALAAFQLEKPGAVLPPPAPRHRPVRRAQSAFGLVANALKNLAARSRK